MGMHEETLAKRAELGDVEAIIELAGQYLSPEAGDGERHKAEELYLRGLEIEPDNPIILRELGLYYHEQDENMEQSQAKAADYFRRSAELGDLLSTYNDLLTKSTLQSERDGRSAIFSCRSNI